MKHAAHSSINPNLSEVTLSTKPSIIYTFAHFSDRVLIGGDVTGKNLVFEIMSSVIFENLQAAASVPLADLICNPAISKLAHY